MEHESEIPAILGNCEPTDQWTDGPKGIFTPKKVDAENRVVIIIKSLSLEAGTFVNQPPSQQYFF